MNRTYTLRDCLMAARLGLHPRQIVLTVIGMLAAAGGFYLLVLLAMVVSGQSGEPLGILSVFCGPANLGLSGIGSALYWLGAFAGLVALLIINIASVRIFAERMKENRGYSIGQAARFAVGKAASLFGSGMLILLIAAFFVLVALLVFLIGKIPLAGELVLSISLILLVIWMAIILLLALLAFINLFLGPVFLAVDDTDALGAVFYSVHLLKSKPLKLIGFITWSLLIAATAAMFSLVLLAAAVYLTNVFGELIVGEAYRSLTAGGIDRIAAVLPELAGALRDLTGAVSSGEIVPGGSLIHSFSAWIWAVSMILVAMLPLAHALASFNGSLLFSVVALYQQVEGEDLLTRHPPTPQNPQDASGSV